MTKMLNNMEAIEKPCLFITSAGRTGTRFFGTQLSRIISHCDSFHEPDLLSMKRREDWRNVLKDFGFLRAILGKVTKTGSIRSLGVARAAGAVDDLIVIDRLRSLRNDFILSQQCEVYCEANQQMQFLTDLLPVAFPNSRTFFIVRDPRDWVRSWMNYPKGWFYEGELLKYLRWGRLTPEIIENDEFANDWKNASRFEKLCWAWNTYNEWTLKRICNQSVITIKFEEIFGNDVSSDTLEQLIRKMVDFPNGFSPTIHFQPQLFQQKIHQSKQTFHHWKEWTTSESAMLHRRCGKLMSELGYGNEPEWLDLIDRLENG